ncbi:aldo/keto reductase [Rubrobacter indicoceani]|uniref:aldo/keto reductase n=1 Tax=Rubrobacter indicoceani TaxID=2051957 RepID=UPI0019694C7B|nr:aldo/keto reductase [Rubrobacter indicoceani]
MNVQGSIEFGDGLTVGRLGYGAMRLTGTGVWGCAENRNQAQEVLIETVRLGVTLLDTADAYGPYTNEDLIHETLSPYPEDFRIATKGGIVRGRDRSWNPDGRPEHLRAACRGSMKRLGVEAIDLYQLHTPDPEVPFEESIGALAELREAGEILNIGLSNVSVEQLRTARGICPIASVQNLFNLSDQTSKDVLEECEKDGTAFLPYFPMAAGDLADSGGAVDEISSERGVTHGQVALAWLLALSPVIVPVPGTSSVEHLRENVAATAITLSEGDLEKLSG